MYKRPVFTTIFKHIKEPRRFIQVLAGPRQTGKSTLAHQVIDAIDYEAHYASADEPTLKSQSWIEQQWETARVKIHRHSRTRKGLLILDEIQKITGWSETVKKLWDEDTAAKYPLQVVLLGSSPLLVQQGLTESLAGRFEIIRIPHWSYTEMRDAFGWNIDQYLFYGGYPGAASLINNHTRWSQYIIDSLIETSISRDILLMTRVDKPALLRRLFEFGCAYSGMILSYNKMLGQLHDAGNTTTLAHYLQLLQGAGMIAGLQKYSGKKIKQRASSPKLIVMNTGLMSAMSGLTLKEFPKDTEFRGRLVETAVGAHLLNGTGGTTIGVYYWSAQNREVDFVLTRGKYVTAIEVKSGKTSVRLPGLDAFAKEFKVHRKLLVGSGGIALEEFFTTPPDEWVP